MYFDPAEARDWGVVVQRASLLVRKATGCERVYIIAFGEGAQHLHLHLIPRQIKEDSTKAWAVADHYRAVEQNLQPSADPNLVEEMVHNARRSGIVLG